MSENLEAKIRERYRSDAEFGRAIGWKRQKVHKMVHGRYEPTVVEAATISKALGITMDRLASFFKE